MKFDEQITAITEYIKRIFADDYSGHDFWHSMRVYKNALKIAKNENCNIQVVAFAALLHDVDDKKLFNTTNYENARNIMSKCEIDSDIQNLVIDVIQIVSFKGKDTVIPNTIEGQIVQDADRIDAIGAIGIARTFAFGGNRGREIYNPNLKPVMNLGEDDYKLHNATTVNHFYEKLFMLKDLMNTETAKCIAENRDKFMHNFIDEFINEWNGIL